MKVLQYKQHTKISIQTRIHEDIPNCYQVMGHTRTIGEKKKSRGYNLKSNKRGNNDACAPQSK